MLRKAGERLRLHYDPAIGVPMRSFTAEMAAAGQAALWAVRCDPPVRRCCCAAPSPTAGAADSRGDDAPRSQARACTSSPVGHAPTLVVPAQVAVVREFLLSP
jgi:hypothetical protein